MVYLLLITGAFLLLASSCRKDDGIPELNTTAVTDITRTSAACGGIIISDGGDEITTRGICWSTEPNPTISDRKMSNGTGEGSFTSNIVTLSSNKTYFMRAYATNSNGTGYGECMVFTTQHDSSAGSFTDHRDGAVYQTVKIGDQVWMAENLKYLPKVVGFSVASQTTPFYYVHGYKGLDVKAAKSTANYRTYGVLYNWPAAMAGSASDSSNPSGVQGVCPAGWHLPSNAEWTQLVNHLYGEFIAGGKLKAKPLWNNPNYLATNETGFAAFPGGGRGLNGVVSMIGHFGYWWSATELDTNEAWAQLLFHEYAATLQTNLNKESAFSVRCVRN